MSPCDKTNNVVFTGPLVLWWSVRWLYIFDCLTVAKPTMLLLQDHWSSGNQWGDCTCLIVSQWQNQQCCFYRITGPLVISKVTVHVCLTVTKPTMFFLQDHWFSGNQGGDCTCLIVSKWQNKQCCFLRTTGPLVISEVSVHIWFSHRDKTKNVFFTGPLVLC